MFNTTPVHAVEVGDAEGLDFEDCALAVQSGVVVPLCGGGGGGGDYGGGGYGGGDYGGGDYGGGDYGGGDYGGGDYGGGDYGGGDYSYGSDLAGDQFFPPLAAYLAAQAAQQAAARYAFLRLAIMVASLEASNGGAAFDPTTTDEEVEQAFD
jgi:hypothetical protein